MLRAVLVVAMASSALGERSLGERPKACPLSGPAPCSGKDDPSFWKFMSDRYARLRRAGEEKFWQPRTMPIDALARLYWLDAIGINKLPMQHFARVLGIPTPHVYLCTRELRELLDIHNASIGAPRHEYVIKRLEGWSSKEVFVMRDGVEQITNRSMTLEDIVNSRAPIDAKRTFNPKLYPWWRIQALAQNQQQAAHHHDSEPAKKRKERLRLSFTYVAEELQHSAQEGLAFARDMKLYAFGSKVPAAAFTLSRVGHTWSGLRHHYCIHCSYTDEGCARKGDLAEFYSVLGHNLSYVDVASNTLNLIDLSTVRLHRPENRAPFPRLPHVETAIKLTRVLAGLLGVMMRIDWYETPMRVPVLTELTLIPNFVRGSMTYEPRFDAILGSLWHGLEGGGGDGEVPCWLPPDWHHRLYTCEGLGGASLEELIAANCGSRRVGGGAGDEQSLAREVARWRAGARSIAGILHAAAASSGRRPGAARTGR